MRKRIVAGNWKMNKTLPEAVALVNELLGLLDGNLKDGVDVVLCTPAPFLTEVGKLIAGKANVYLGAQNCYPKPSGAFTGELSVPMLKSVGVGYVIIGHSERREYFGETDAFVGEKVKAILTEGLTPIFCCGESLPVRESGKHVEFTCNQIEASLFTLSADELQKVVIAYEPIWAIGTGVTASPEQAQDMHAELRKFIGGKYGENVAQNVSILYGGSANAANAATLFALPDVDGGLIGGASLKAPDFATVVNA